MAPQAHPDRTWSDDFAGDAATAALIGGASLADWWHVDDTVLDALSHLSGQEIDSVVDIWHLVEDQSYHLTDGWLDAIQGHVGEGLFISIRGHVGEQMAAHDLTSAGASVTWPEAANQQGWDLNVDGHLVNVKVTVDAGAAAAEHFATNPDIPVIVNADAANIPDSAIYFDPATGIDPSLLTGEHVVLVDDALSAHAAMGAVQDAFGGDAIHGALTDASIPVLTVVITAARSGWREEKLRRDGKTSWIRAGKNIAVDTGARTVGIVAGAKAGAAAGAVVDASTLGATLGLATVVGTILGALGGGMGGSAVARRLRLAPLRTAQGCARDALYEYDSATATALEVAQDAYQRAQASARFALSLRAHIARVELDNLVAAERATTRERRKVDAAEIILRATGDENETANGPPRGIQVGVPSKFRAAAHRRAMQTWEGQLWGAARHANDDYGSLAIFWDTVAATPAGQRQMHGWLNELEEQRALGYARLGVAAQRATTNLRIHQQRVRARVISVGVEEVARGRETLEPITDRVRTTHEAFITELLAAGLEPQSHDEPDSSDTPARRSGG